MIELLKALIAAKSLSRHEKAAIDVLSDQCKKDGIDVQMVGNNMVMSKGKGDKTLLFVSHLDTVPAAEGWTSDPYTAIEKEGRIYGLGSCDAKGQVVALYEAFKSAKVDGRLIFAAVCQEEISGKDGIRKVLEHIGHVDAAVVAEPTCQQVCHGVTGLAYLNLITKGVAAHAVHAKENVIVKAINDVNTIEQYNDDTLKITPTLIQSGKVKNVAPDSCTCTFDVRYNKQDLDRLCHKINENIAGTLHITSNYEPRITHDDNAIVTLALAQNGQDKSQIFPAFCDAYFLDCPFIIFGPGLLEVAHHADEYVPINHLHFSAKFYASLAQRYLSQ